MYGYETYDDAQLLVLLKKSDMQAFEQIYSRYWKKLFVLAFHKLRSKQDAEDIVHDIFSSIWQRRSEMNIQSLEAYLATAVKYKIISYFNKAIDKTLSIPGEENEPISDDDLPFDKLSTKLLANLIDQNIQQLAEKCRIVFQHSRIAGKSNPEIAEELNISRKMVEKHISTALSKLRASLKDLLPFLF